MTTLDYNNARPGLGAEYRPRGLFSPTRLPLALLVGLIGGAALGLVYTLAVFYIPFLKLRFLATLAAGFGAGGIGLWLMDLGHVRSRATGALLCLFVAAVAYYASWATWIPLAYPADDATWASDVLYVALRPATIVDAANFMYDEGYWLEGKTPANGFKIAAVWAIEAAILLGIAPALGWRGASSKPYCERCGSWCKTREGVAVVGDADPAALRRDLLGGDLAALERAGPADLAAATPRVRVDRADCPGCGGLRTASVKRLTWVEGKEQPTLKERFVVRHLVLDDAQAAWVDDALAAQVPSQLKGQPAGDLREFLKTESDGPPPAA